MAPTDQLSGRLGPQFNPLMAIIMVVLVSAFFVMGFFSVYIRQCMQRRVGSREGLPPGIAGVGRRSWRTGRGLDPSVIEMFPTFLYSTVKGLKIGKGVLECAVCLNEFEDDETLRLIPKCSHVFHPDCIDAWLSSHTTCPVCRANLVPKPGEIISHPAVTNPDPDSIQVEPENRLDNNQGAVGVGDDHTTDLESQNTNLINTTSPLTNHHWPRRSRSTGWRLTGFFTRSHSTGHSLVQPGEDCERFTLRLPDEVRSHLMTSTLNRTRSCVAFPSARSTRRGYRAESVRSFFQYERFDQENRFGFSLTPPFLTRTGSVRAGKIGGGEEVGVGSPKGLFKPSRSPF